MTKIYTKNTWVDEVLSGDERYNILADDDTPIESTVQIELDTAVAQAGTPVDASKMNNLEDGVDQLDTLLDLLLTGWVASSGWTYASATTFTVSGDLTGVFTPGTKIKLTQTTAKYFYVVSSSYSSPNTTVTITGGSDYTLANAAITSPHYSYNNNPQGFPHNFAYTITVVGLTNPVYAVQTGYFSISGRTVTCRGRLDITSWGSQSGYILIEPPTPATGFGMGVGSMSYYRVGGSAQDGTNNAVISTGNNLGMTSQDGGSTIGWEASARVLIIFSATYMMA